VVTQKRVGFIIDNNIPNICFNFLDKLTPHFLRQNSPSTSPTTEMRFRWVADHVNSRFPEELVYELFHIGCKYDVVVFLKSLSNSCIQLQDKLKQRGVKTVFDLNVDYLTPAWGKFYYENMAPENRQHLAAIEMAKRCDVVLCPSNHIASVAKKFNASSFCLPDNIKDDFINTGGNWKPDRNKRLQVLWCGQAVKLFELLKIQDTLMLFSDRIHLKIITNSISVMKKWYEPYENHLSSLLSHLSYEIIPFTSISDLMAEYDKGGIFISPRFLNNSYNLGHSEWKITLAMAKGRVVLASDLQSYVDVNRRSLGKGIRICKTNEDWNRAFAEILDPDFLWPEEQKASLKVVRNFYSTSVISKKHSEILLDLVC